MSARGYALRQVAHLSGHDEGITCLAWGPGSGLLASGSRDASVRLWNVSDQRCTTIDRLSSDALDPTADYVTCVEWSPSGGKFLTTSKGGRVRIVAPDSWQVIFDDHAKRDIFSACWSPTGGQIALGTRGGGARLVRLDEDRLETGRDLPGEGLYSASVRFSPNGRLLAWGTYGGYLNVSDARTGEVVCTRQVDSESLHDLAWTADGDQLLTVAGGRCLAWSTDTWAPTAECSLPSERLVAVSVDRDGDIAWCASRSGVLYAWPLDAAEPAEAIQFDDGEVYPMLLHHPEQQLIAITIDSGTSIRVWRYERREASRPRIVRAVDAPHRPAAPGAAEIQDASVAQARHSTFISFGSPDEEFARRLKNGLERHGVRTFFFPDHAMPGERLHDMMRRVNNYGRVILICSKDSLDRKGVLNELDQTLAREAREGGESLLVPITIDDYVFDGWSPPHAGRAQEIKDRFIADFRDPDSFEKCVTRLVDALAVPDEK